LFSVEGLNARILNAWKSCPRKKLIAAAAATTFWNVASVKTRVMAGTLLNVSYYLLIDFKVVPMYCLVEIA
jgi:hypothetical protein